LQKVKHIIFLILVTYGCSTSRKSITANIDLGSPSSISENEIVKRNITNNDFSIQKAEVKVNAEETRTDLVASIKYQKEGKYLISIRSKSGIEVVRIFLTNDTILANDRIHKKIYCGSAAYMEDKYGISFRSLPLIFGDFIDVDGAGKEIIDCKEGKGVFLNNMGEKALTMTIDCREGKVIGSVINSENGDSRLEIKYKNFHKYENMIYPAVINIIETKTGSYIRIEIKKIVFNTVEKLIFIPGSNYESIMLK
jgi:hypothetical protein